MTPRSEAAIELWLRVRLGDCVWREAERVLLDAILSGHTVAAVQAVAERVVEQRGAMWRLRVAEYAPLAAPEPVVRLLRKPHPPTIRAKRAQRAKRAPGKRTYTPARPSGTRRDEQAAWLRANMRADEWHPAQPLYEQAIRAGLKATFLNSNQFVERRKVNGVRCWRLKPRASAE